MKSLLSTRIGIPNVIAIAVITVAVGFLSILSLMNLEQAQEMRIHWVRALLGRMGILMGVSQGLIGALLAGNLIQGFITRDAALKNRFIAVFIWATMATFIVALTGSCFLIFS